jgi:DNA-binding MarR family transcriptional regulator
MQARSDVVAAASAACTRFVDATRIGMSQVLDVTRVGVLRLAVERGPIRPTDIAAGLDVNPSTVTRQLQALHRLGFIAMSEDPQDRRAALASATAEGRRQLRTLDETGLAVFAAVVEEWSTQDLVTLTELLSRMVNTWAERATDQHQQVHARRVRSADPWWAGS